MGCISSQVGDDVAALVERFAIDKEAGDLTLATLFNEFSSGLRIDSCVSGLNC